MAKPTTTPPGVAQSPNDEEIQYKRDAIASAREELSDAQAARRSREVEESNAIVAASLDAELARIKSALAQENSIAEAGSSNSVLAAATQQMEDAQAAVTAQEEAAKIAADQAEAQAKLEDEARAAAARQKQIDDDSIAAAQAAAAKETGN